MKKEEAGTIPDKLRAELSRLEGAKARIKTQRLNASGPLPFAHYLNFDRVCKKIEQIKIQLQNE